MKNTVKGKAWGPTLYSPVQMMESKEVKESLFLDPFGSSVSFWGQRVPHNLVSFWGQTVPHNLVSTWGQRVPPPYPCVILGAKSAAQPCKTHRPYLL